MSEARTKLEQLEASTDWQALVDLALADPPDPGPLFYTLRDWRVLFAVVHGGAPLAPDCPPAVDGFIRRVAFCNVPEPFHRFVDGFVAKHGRRPRATEFPADLEPFLATLGRPMRRPRLDTVHLRTAARAWEGYAMLYTYEINRDLYRALGRQSGVTVIDFDRQTIATTSPSDLAEAKIATDRDKLLDDIRDKLNAARATRRTKK